MIKPLFYWLAVWALCLLSACKHEKSKPDALFSLLDSETTGIGFSNDIQQTDSMNILEYMYFYNGAGVGLGDINNDGLTDVFFSGNMVPSRLYLNKGNFQFEDVTEKAGINKGGWCTGVSMVDINADGLLDIYVSRAGSKNPAERANLLFINKGNSTFQEMAAAYGVADTGYSTQAAFFDYDHDGDLDLYLLTHDHSPKAANNLMPVRTHGEAKNTDKLFRNNGLGPKGHPVFSDVSASAGIQTEGYGLGVAINDINEDGWPDIYVANDFLSNDLLYINNQDGTFTNKIGQYLKHQSYNAMGVDIADYNNDGLQDIVVMDMLPEDNYRQKIMAAAMSNEKFDFMLQMGYQPQYMRNTLQLNKGGGRFSEIGQLAGVDKTDWSWAPLLADFDNDGYKDLFVTNGILKNMTDKDFIKFSQNSTMFKDSGEVDATLLKLMEGLKGVKLPNYIFRNNHDLTFSNARNWGMDQPSYSNGAAYGDLDNDGDLDLVVNNVNDKAFVYRNEAQKLQPNAYLQFSLQGDSLNRLALGTKITLHYQGQKQVYEHTPYRGFQSTVSNTVHFGLGKITQVDTVDIIWPNGRMYQLFNIPVNRVLKVDQRQSPGKPHSTLNAAKPVFEEISKQLGVDFVHSENDYFNPDAQIWMPHAFSTLGPSMAAGDIDGNGLEDFYVGGAAGNPGIFFLQQTSGRFLRRAFLLDKACEDTGSLLFDADQDGDLDLYVASGGNEFPAGSALYNDRLYKNNGKGNFRRDITALPAMTASKSCVTAADFDGDGDLDIFVGGRVVPGKYPLAPESYLLRNDKGKFTNVTETICAGLKTIGMVTSALWTDFDNDGHTDLMVAGEWMPVMFFKNKGGKLVNVTSSTGLGETSGWWNSIVGADMDHDGDTDYILGNLGENTPFKASEKEPLSLYSGAFEGNGVYHAVMSWYIQGKNYPWPSRDVLLRQMPRVAKRFFKYDDYAKATMGDLFPADIIKKASVLKSGYFSSSYLKNLGNGKFTLIPLPQQAQVAPVSGILPVDVDHDGHLDLILSGNSYAPDASIGRYDAFYGLYLKGNGHGKFQPVGLKESGLVLEGDSRALIQISTANRGKLIVGASNAGRLKIYAQAKVTKTRLAK
jgi:hypothetical protein